MANREELIRSALLEKAGQGMTMYTADEILAVAGITPEQIEEFVQQINDSAGRLAGEGERA